jgi:uncharacterized protein (DUF983 family)
MKNSDNLLAGLIGPCPQCGNGRFEAVSDGELTNLLCPGCGACWHAEVASVRRVDPPHLSRMRVAVNLRGRRTRLT